MPGYKVKLLKKENIADGTMAFYWDKPQGFDFKAGQYLDMILLNPPETDSEGNIRTFSIASAPSETEIIIATRMRDSAFKRVLKNMPLGSEVQIDGPHGSFTLHNNPSKPASFLIGGIGITPIRSILLEAAQRKLPHKLYLFYSNRQPKDAAFLNELDNLQKENSNYKFIPTITDLSFLSSAAEIWDGERGYIDKGMLLHHLGDLSSPIYYIAGPPEMVMAMRKMLNESGVDDDDIKAEEFSGY